MQSEILKTQILIRDKEFLLTIVFAIVHLEIVKTQILTRKSELRSFADDCICFCEIRDSENKVKLQDDKRMIMKGCMQWNPVYGQKDFRFQWVRSRDREINRPLLTH